MEKRERSAKETEAKNMGPLSSGQDAGQSALGGFSAEPEESHAAQQTPVPGKIPSPLFPGAEKIREMHTTIQESIKSYVDELKRFSESESVRRAWSEYYWPIGSSLFLMRPLHYWLTGKVADIQAGSRVLEVAAGYPWYKLYADKVGPEGLFVAVDINENIQRRSQKLCYAWDRFFSKEDSAQSHAPTRLATADAYTMPFPSNTFDTIVVSNLTGSDEYVAETYRLLRPGGNIVSALSQFWSTPEYSEWQVKQFQNTGFEDIRMFPGMTAHFVPGLIRNWYVAAKKPGA